MFNIRMFVTFEFWRMDTASLLNAPLDQLWHIKFRHKCHSLPAPSPSTTTFPRHPKSRHACANGASSGRSLREAGPGAGAYNETNENIPVALKEYRRTARVKRTVIRIRSFEEFHFVVGLRPLYNLLLHTFLLWKFVKFAFTACWLKSGGTALLEKMVLKFWTLLHWWWSKYDSWQRFLLVKIMILL